MAVDACTAANVAHVMCLIALIVPANGAHPFAPGATITPMRASTVPTPDWTNVRSFGAIGDGTADDSPAIQRAIDACLGREPAGSGGTLYFPAGAYRVTRTLNFTATGGLALPPHAIVGDGWTSLLLWDTDEASDLLHWPTLAAHVNVRDFAVVGIGAAKRPNSTAMRFGEGVAQSTFNRLLWCGARACCGLLPGRNVSFLGGALDLGTLTDTVEVVESVAWAIRGTGIKIGHGSQVLIRGGRVIGGGWGGPDPPPKRPGNIGVHLTGNNGGVHITDTDLIAMHDGMIIENSSGAGSNREIFITHATFDGNWRGLSILDHLSYTSVAGLWAASSYDANVFMGPSAGGSMLAIAGGTIFNSGVLGHDSLAVSANGITVHAGSFTMTGVIVRNNLGRGVWIPATAAPFEWSITGCRFFGNGVAIAVDSPATRLYAVTGNVLSRNTNASHFGPVDAAGAVVANNVVGGQQ